MNRILQEILAHKRQEVEKLKVERPLAEIIEARCPYDRRDFRAVLTEKGRINIIAEIKKASPSKGIIRPEFDPDALARSYHQGGVAAISVLTDRRYFQGDGDYIGRVKEAVPLPILCKEFVVDPYQVYLARVWGADAILLIVACLGQKQLAQYIELVRELGLGALVEVHTRQELANAMESGAGIIGINNRNLETFEIDLTVSERLAGEIPDNIIKVSESGINGRSDIDRLRRAGFSNFLIGEALMRSADPAGLIQELRK